MLGEERDEIGEKERVKGSMLYIFIYIGYHEETIVFQVGRRADCLYLPHKPHHFLQSACFNSMLVLSVQKMCAELIQLFMFSHLSCH